MAKSTAIETPIKPSAINFDDFMGEDFTGEAGTLPHAQILNDQLLDRSGIWISKDKADECGFVPSAGWVSHPHTFKDGKSSEGYRCVTPRLVVLRTSDLLMAYREGRGDKMPTLFDKAAYNSADMVASQRYMVFFLDASNKPIHTTPIQFTTKGSFSSGFAEVLKGFKASVNSAFTAMTKDSKPRGEKFFGLVALQLTLGTALKGKAPNAAWCSTIDKFQKVTPDNFSEFFLGSNPVLKEMMFSAYDGNPKFGELKDQEPRTQSFRGSEDHMELMEGIRRAIVANDSEAVTVAYMTAIAVIEAQYSEGDRKIADQIFENAMDSFSAKGPQPVLFSKPKGISREQAGDLWARLKAEGWTPETVKNALKSRGIDGLGGIPESDLLDVSEFFGFTSPEQWEESDEFDGIPF